MSDWPPEYWTTGFDDRTFLTEQEWKAYQRNYPVRYTDKNLRKPYCSCCDKPGSPKNKLQLAHRIPFKNGVQYLALTPDFLNSSKNLVTAHKKKCNRASELGFIESLRRLKELGEISLPKFLPMNVHEAWQQIANTEAHNTRD